MAGECPVREIWFAARIKRNAFIQAERSLTLNGLTVFAPKIERRILRYGKQRPVQKLLFPGYIFVEGGDAQNLWAAIRATQGLVRLVLSSTKEPTAMPPEFMGALFARCDAEGRLRGTEELSAGARVSLISGPFAGLVSKIEQIDERERIWILLDLLGSSRRIMVSPKHLVRLT